MSFFRKETLPISSPMRAKIVAMRRKGRTIDDIERATGAANADICSVLIDENTAPAVERNLNAFEVIG